MSENLVLHCSRPPPTPTRDTEPDIVSGQRHTPSPAIGGGKRWCNWYYRHAPFTQPAGQQTSPELQHCPAQQTPEEQTCLQAPQLLMSVLRFVQVPEQQSEH